MAALVTFDTNYVFDRTAYGENAFGGGPDEEIDGGET
jgi:hypothetical protein